MTTTTIMVVVGGGGGDAGYVGGRGLAGRLGHIVVIVSCRSRWVAAILIESASDDDWTQRLLYGLCPLNSPNSSERRQWASTLVTSVFISRTLAENDRFVTRSAWLCLLSQRSAAMLAARRPTILF